MKVLAFTSLFPSSSAPTLGTFNLHTFRALAEVCDLRVVAPFPAWTRLSKPAELLSPRHGADDGVEATYPAYFSVPGLPVLHGEAMYRSLRGHVARLRHSFPYDVIVSAWSYPDTFAAAHFAQEAGCPLMAAMMGSDINALPHRFGLRRQIAWGLSRAQRVLAVSRAMVDPIVGLGVPRDRVVVQHNAVDGELFAIRDRAEARRRVGIDHDRPVVCYIGNIRPVKGTDILVEAMDQLVHGLGRTDVQLVIVGSGEIEHEVRARAAALGLGEEHVRFCGRQLHTEIPSWMNACDVFCLPSRDEGCPNVVLEALASGKPVVASRAGGIPELIDDGHNGILAPVGDAAALARGLDAALSRTWEPVALRGSVEYLSWSAVARTYLRHLTAILDEQSAEYLEANPA